jgi:glycerol-3-phosphate acyltransferase PlsY
LAYGIIYLIGKIFKQDIAVTLNIVFLIAATIGHCYPIYYAFKGGKGVLVCLTAVCLIDIKIAIVCLIAGLLIILITRMVSAGSIGGVLLFDIMILVMQSEYIIPALIVSAIILLKHRSNIHRIFEGQENKLF